MFDLRGAIPLFLVATTSRGRVQTSPSVVHPLVLMCFVVNAAETRHRLFLSERYATGGTRTTHTSGAEVSSTTYFRDVPRRRAVKVSVKLFPGVPKRHGELRHKHKLTPADDTTF